MNYLRTIFLLVTTACVVLGLTFTNRLAESMEAEEQKKVEIWAEATRQFIMADEDTDIDFVSTIIEGNTTIPVYMTDADGQYMLCRNVDVPKKIVGTDAEVAYYQKQIDRLKQMQEPIYVYVAPGQTQYIYYDESTILKRIRLVPYIAAVLIVLFLMIAVMLMRISHLNEQNKVWAGLSKETAHQLGTPISSLNGWLTLLRSQYPADTLLPEMEKDISRLGTIAERFSKIGSIPKAEQTAVQPLLDEAIGYMRSRSSERVNYTCVNDNPSVQALLTPALFGWVMENLMKNALDAGATDIKIAVTEQNHQVWIDVSDNGHGLARKVHRKIFTPGYTTKQRGWGLGLSLSRRIISEYCRGNIYVLHSSTSEPDHGTTFRITLRS